MNTEASFDPVELTKTYFESQELLKQAGYVRAINHLAQNITPDFRALFKGKTVKMPANVLLPRIKAEVERFERELSPRRSLRIFEGLDHMEEMEKYLSAMVSEDPNVLELKRIIQDARTKIDAHAQKLEHEKQRRAQAREHLRRMHQRAIASEQPETAHAVWYREEGYLHVLSIVAKDEEFLDLFKNEHQRLPISLVNDRLKNELKLFERNHHVGRLAPLGLFDGRDHLAEILNRIDLPQFGPGTDVWRFREAVDKAKENILERRKVEIARKERKRTLRMQEEEGTSCRRMQALANHAEFVSAIYTSLDDLSWDWVDLLGSMIKTIDASSAILPATEETPTGLVDNDTNSGLFSEEQPGHVLHEVVLSHITGANACSACLADPLIQKISDHLEVKLSNAKLDLLIRRPLDSRERQDAATLRALFYTKVVQLLLRESPLQYLSIKDESQQTSQSAGQLPNPATQNQAETDLPIVSSVWITKFGTHLLHLLEDCQLPTSYFTPDPPRSDISASLLTSTPLCTLDLTILEAVLDSTIYPDTLWPEPALAPFNPLALVTDFLVFLDPNYSTDPVVSQWVIIIKARLGAYWSYRDAVEAGELEEDRDEPEAELDIRAIYADDEDENEEGGMFPWGRPVLVKAGWYRPNAEADRRREEDDGRDEEYESDWEAERDDGGEMQGEETEVVAG